MAANRRAATSQEFASGDYHNTNAQWNPSTSQETGRTTTHGLGIGQGIHQQSDMLRGQEFGQGHEQVSSDEGIENSPAAGISTATTKPNTRTDRQEGENK